MVAPKRRSRGDDFSARLQNMVNDKIRDEQPRIRGSMTAHSGGNKVEKLCLDLLKDLGAMRTHVFLQKKIKALRSQHSSPTELEAYLRTQWWWMLNPRSKKTFKKLNGKVKISPKQDDTADLVVEDAGKVRLINVKSHREGGTYAPNIISFEKVLRFFDEIPADSRIRNRILKEAEVYFLSISWKKGGHITQAHVKRLTKIRVSEINRLNFSAAQQIQFQVESIREDLHQSALTFAKDLASKVQVQIQRERKRLTALNELARRVNGLP